MDKLKDEVRTNQSLLQNRQDTIFAIIAMVLLLILMLAFIFFGPERL